MKKIFLTLSFFYCALSISAQNTFPSSGNVGVYTTSPNANFSVHGTSIFAGSAANLDPAYTPNAFNYLANTGQMLLGWNRSAGLGEIDLISNRGGGGAGGFSFYDYSNAGLLKLLLQLNGNGDAALNGTFLTKQIIVETSGWPDYVFKPSYKLPPLDEIKSYIERNHHLPEVPSEREIVEKGLNLGEMNKLLLKKVEELTLYLIDKNTTIENLERRLTALEKTTNHSKETAVIK